MKSFKELNLEVREVGDDPINDGTPPELRKRGNKTVITSDEIKEAVKDKLDIGEYDQEGDMAKSDLRSIMANAQKLHDMIEDADNLPEWCQNKITLAEDYISTVANYLTAEMNESDVYGKPTTAKTPTVTLKHKTSGKEIVVTKKSAPGYKRIGYYISESWSKTGKVAKHNKTGEETHEYAKVDKEGRKTGEREYRNAQGKPMGEDYESSYDEPRVRYERPIERDSRLYKKPNSAQKNYNKTSTHEYFAGTYNRNVKKQKPNFEAVNYGNAQGKPMGEELEEAKVYDPFTKKMVPTKPIKIQAGGGATRNGVPVEKRTMSQAAGALAAEAVTYGNAYPGLGDDVVDKKKKLNPQPALTMKPKQVKDFIDKTYKGYSEEVELDEGTMTGITLGQKVKNKQGGYNQDVHHKGKKIGHIEAYKHRTGIRYGHHLDATGDGGAGSRSSEESIADLRYDHAQHLKDKKVSEDVELDESLITGTKKISTHEAGQHKAEVRHNSEYNEFQVHYYKDGKHRGEGPVSYHEDDRADATASAKREIERLGKTQKEEVEQIDELSKRTLARYAKRATSSMKMKQMAATHLRDKHRDASDKHQAGVFNRETGIKRAIDKLAGKYYHEDVEQIDEISRDLADRYVSKVTQQQVQKQGMQPNMYDKLPKNRQQGVSNALKRTLVKSPVKEETEQIDELSKDTLASYANKAVGDVSKDRSKNIKLADKKLYGNPNLNYKKESVEESKAHKVLNTFFKNREVAQRAFTGQNKPKGPDSIMDRNKHINNLMKSQVKESRKAEIIKDIMKKKKSEKFEPEPIIGTTVTKSDQQTA